MRLGDGYSVSFYNGIMKILTVISLLTTILNPFITNANGTYSNIVQASYSYGIGYFDVGTSGGNSIDSQYYIDIDINIQGTYSGYIYINTTLPSSTMSSTYYPKYISVGGNYVGSGYTNAGITSFCFKITSSSHLYVRLYYGLGTLHTYFGLLDNANQNLNWTNSGNQYVDITSISVSSFTKDSDLITYIDDIESSINTLKTYTDSVENYLLQIWNNVSDIYSTLTVVSTNVVDIENILSSITNKLDNINKITWLDLNTQYKGYSTELLYNPENLNTGTVTNNGTGYVYMYATLPGNIASEFPIIKVVFPVEIFTVYQTFEFGFVGSNNALVKFDTLFTRSTRGAVEIYFTLDTPYYGLYDVHFCLKISGNNIVVRPTNSKGVFYINENDKNYWTVYSSLSQLNQLNGIQSSINQIISILGTSDLSQSDQQNKTTTDNFFNQLLENLNLPSFPDKETQPLFPILQEFIGYYGQIVGNQHMSMYRWLLGLSSVFLVLKVILL